MQFPICLTGLRAWIHSRRQGGEGRLVDAADSKALAYATVVALNKDGKQAASAITYPDGRFSVSLPRKAIISVVTFVGYQSLSKKIAFDNSRQDLGERALKAGVEVQSVKIKTRQIVRRETDRLVYDVASDPDAKRMRMMEIMGKIPELEMNAANGKLQYENTPVTRIYVNGQSLHLPRQALPQFSPSLSPATVKKYRDSVPPARNLSGKDPTTIHCSKSHTERKESLFRDRHPLDACY